MHAYHRKQIANILKMNTKLNSIIEERGWLLADGATGTNLFERGLQSGESPEIWNVENPKAIADLYRSSIEAGCDLFLTNSFGGNRARLKLHSAADRAFELSRAAAEIGREESERRGGHAIVAGSMGPTGELIEPLGELSFSLAIEIFHEQAEALKSGGVDLLWVETMSSTEEFRAAARACALAAVPWCGTMSFDTAGKTMMGVTAADLEGAVKQIPNSPLAFGANCGAGASDLVRTLLGFSNSDSRPPLISKGNAGIPKYVDGEIHYDGTPSLMAKYAELALRAGAQIIGGCCGTSAKHLVAMRNRLETHVQGERPTLNEIEKTLGGFTYKDKVEARAPRRKARRPKRN